MAAAAMQVLPPGFPKVIITPLASGIRPFGPFIGIRDIMVMHSLVDIAGINEISRTIFNNAVAAISGMVHQNRTKLIPFTNTRSPGSSTQKLRGAMFGGTITSV